MQCPRRGSRVTRSTRPRHRSCFRRCMRSGPGVPSSRGIPRSRALPGPPCSQKMTMIRGIRRPGRTVKFVGDLPPDAVQADTGCRARAALGGDAGGLVFAPQGLTVHGLRREHLVNSRTDDLAGLGERPSAICSAGSLKYTRTVFRVGDVDRGREIGRELSRQDEHKAADVVLRTVPHARGYL